MSTWELIENKLKESIVPVYLTKQEYTVVQEALASIVKSRLNEGSAWSLFEELSEAAMTIPVKGMSDQEADTLKRKFPELGAQLKKGNTGYILMLEPKTWQNVKKQIEADKSLRGLGPAEDLIQKIDSALQLVQGTAAPPKGQSPSFGPKQDMIPAVARETGFNDPSQSATAPRFTGGTGGGSPFASKTGGTTGSTMREPERELDPLEIDTDALHAAHGTVPNQAAKVKAQDVASMQGSGKPKTTVLDPKDQEKTDDMEDPSTWGEGIKILKKMMEEAQ